MNRRPTFFLLGMLLLATAMVSGCSGEYHNTPAEPSGTLDDDSADDDTGALDDDAWLDDDSWLDDDHWPDDDTGPDDDADDDAPPFDGFGVLFINVGLGDAALLALPDGAATRYVLIDGGKIGDGEFTICPILEDQGIETLDVVVMTHPHFDHCGGLSEIFDCVSVEEVWENGDELPGDETWEAYLSARDAWGGPVLNPGLGAEITVGQAIFRVLSTDSDLGSINDNSLVVQMEYQGLLFLFGADAESPSQSEMVQAWPDQLPSRVVKIPCHACEFDQGFIDLVAASLGIVSVGPNELGYPDLETLEAYRMAGTELFSTEESGHILLSLDEGGEIVATTEAP